MKQLILFLFVFMTCFFTKEVDGKLKYSDKQEIPIINEMHNGGLEYGMSGFTLAGSAVISKELSTIRTGVAALKVVTSGSIGDGFTTRLVSIRKNHGNCEAHFWYNSTAATFEAKVVDDLSNVKSKVISLPATDGYELGHVTFTCTDTARTYQLAILDSAAVIHTLYFDDGYIGELQKVDKSQAEFVGSITFSSNCSFSASATTFTTMSSDASCTTTIVGDIEEIESGGNRWLGFKLSNYKEGHYKVTYTGQLYDATADGNYCNYRFAHSTNSWGEQSAYTTGAQSMSGQVLGSYTFSTAGTNLETYVQTYQTGPGSCSASGSTTQKISLYRFPQQTEKTYRFDTANQFAGIRFTGGSASILSTSATFATANDAVLGTNTLIGKAVLPTTSNDFATKVSDLKPGSYLVLARADFRATYGTALTGCEYALTDSGVSSPYVAGIVAKSTNTDESINVLWGLFTYSNTATREFKVALRRSSGDGNCYVNVGAAYNDPAITVVPLSQNIPAPVMVNSRTSDYLGVTKRNSALIAGASEATTCSSSPCTVYRESGDWISSVTWSSTGTYVANFVAGIFATEPTCTANSKTGAQSVRCRAQSETTSSVNIYCYNDNTAAFADNIISIECEELK